MLGIFCRQNDLQMLEKINELDEKLRCMEKEASERQESVVQLISVRDGHNTVTESGSHVYPEKKSTSGCTLPLAKEKELKGTPMTPRETSLLVQLNKVRLQVCGYTSPCSLAILQGKQLL